jgi:hypothetical protein
MLMPPATFSLDDLIIKNRLIREAITTILFIVNVKHYRLLHFVLIFLLIISPLRSALAMQLMQCEMENMMDDVTANMAVASHHAEMHTMHVSTNASPVGSSHQLHVMQTESAQPVSDQHQCCCCDDGSNCMGNCDLGMNASLVILVSAYTPAFVEVTQAPIISTDVIIRELTPPSRPPATLHS